MNSLTPNSKPKVSLDLIVRNGSKTGHRIPIDRPILLGRDPRSRIAFGDTQMSRLHALIEHDHGKVIVRDLGSVNGVFVNGLRILAIEELKAGDTIRLGQTEMAVERSLGSLPVRTPVADHATNSDATGESQRDASHHSSSGVLLPSAVLSKALEFAAQCSTITSVDQVGDWLLPRLCQVFESQGAAVVHAPRGSTNRDAEVLASTGDEAQAQRLTTGAWSHNRPSRAVVKAQPKDIAAMSVPLLLRQETVILLLFWRGGDRQFAPGDEHLGRAFAGLMVGGPLAGVFEKLADSGLDTVFRSNHGLTGDSAIMAKMREELRRAALTNATVLVTGESGTGKELAARAIVALSQRAAAPYIALNMAAVPPDLIEAELFGHEKGSFSGATAQRLGKLEQAHRGTVFLDEIGDLPLDLQAKLLRVLEGHPFYRIGGDAAIRVDVRFICATHRPLEQMIGRGQFRTDLYHRINILRLELPALREHIEDLPELCRHLLAAIARHHAITGEVQLKPKTIAHLMRYEWPGNVRELRNVLEQMLLLSGGGDLDEQLLPRALRPQGVNSTEPLMSLQSRTSEMERREIIHALVEAEGVKSRAAVLIGISRPTLDKKIRLYQLDHLVSKAGG